uniref:NADH-ubiquinone oxidoreductase chain 6 n=1 Tax=Hycleus marcipoli TaxID=1914940 RepID=A0A343A7D4_9CUCU|nr:NADH dehydrogenase subunit 6 [Hycleus marcipoli]APB02788.1 NADH dehydrogenase subunit 6 [Hycleus marcipoli]
MLLTMNITLSILFMFMNHPLSLGLILLLQTTIISLVSGQLCLNYWFSYILFLILVGGMLILFIYMTSIASNEKFNLKIKLYLFLTISMFTSLLVSLENQYMTDSYLKNELTSMETSNLNFSMIKFISFPMNLILLFMIIYLFIALIAIVKIIDRKQGPLRPKY